MFSFVQTSISATQSEEKVLNTQLETKNYFNKLHFYFPTVSENDTSKTVKYNTTSFSTIDTMESINYSYINKEAELYLALENMNSFSVKDNSIVKMTVEFVSRFTETEEYINFVEERTDIKTVEDLRNFRRRYT